MPTGRPCRYPAGTVRCGYPATAAAVETRERAAEGWARLVGGMHSLYYATAAEADAAASLIGNAVNVDAPGIVRVPAKHLKDDSDLGDIPVTLDVPELTPWQVAEALKAGREHALALRAAGHIQACFITCQGWTLSTENSGTVPLPLNTSHETNAQGQAARVLELHP